MRKSIVVAALLLAVVAVMPAHATDCNAPSYTYFSYVDYSPEQLWEQKSTWDCWSLSGLGATTLSSFSTPGFEMRALSGNATRVFTVPAGAGGYYEISMIAELHSPDATWYDQINASVSVYHPANNSTTWYTLYYRNGGQGDDSGSSPYVDIYNVAAGDTITISIGGAWSFNSDAHARFSAVHIFHITG